MLVCHRRRDASFGHDGVRFTKQRFTDNTNARTLPERFDGRAQTGAAGANNQNIVFVSFELFIHSNLKS